MFTRYYFVLLLTLEAAFLVVNLMRGFFSSVFQLSAFSIRSVTKYCSITKCESSKNTL